jgi:hypothetical protein
MKKIKSIKEIVTSPILKNKEEVHFIGEIVTKKNHSWGKGKNKHERTKFLVKSDNFCITCSIESEDKNYEELLNKIKIDKIRYFEGKINNDLIGIGITVTYVSSNIMLKKLEHEEESLEIRFLKHIYSHDEDAALNLLKNNAELNTNYEFNGNIPLLTVIDNKFEMVRLFEALVNHPKTNISIEDGFGEPLLNSLIYLYCADDTQKDKNQLEFFEKLINIVLNCERYDFNIIDLNNDTAINVACDQLNNRTLWIVEALAKKENVNLNIINNFDCAALGNCIVNKNLECLKIISKRKDLIVRDEDREIAKKYGIDLSEYGLA